MYASVITDQIDEDLETALRIARLYGYTHVELHNVFGKSIEECSLKEINEERNATILMVTHDAFSASYARKVFILKDGEIFTTLHADAERSVFYERILQLLASMGGD